MDAFGKVSSYSCAVHKERPGAGVCAVCGATVCAECARRVSGRVYCPSHAPADDVTTAAAAARLRLRPGLLAVFFGFVAATALALWTAPALTSNVLGFYYRGLAEIEFEEAERGLESFRADVGRYPTAEEGLRALREEPPGTRTWLGPYLRDELFANDTVVDPYGNPIAYYPTGDGYRLRSAGPDGEPETDDDLTFEGPRRNLN